MARFGMDADAVDESGRALRDRALAIEAIVAKVDQSVDTLLGTWFGQDASLLSHQWWPDQRRILTESSAAITELADSLIMNAVAQREASLRPKTQDTDDLADLAKSSAGGGARVAPDLRAGGTGVVPPTSLTDVTIDSADPMAWAALRRGELGLPRIDLAGVDRGALGETPTLGAVGLIHRDGEEEGAVVVESIEGEREERIRVSTLGPSGPEVDHVWERLADGTWSTDGGEHVAAIHFVP
jgi:uncharacterized protein YukE